MRIGIVNDLPMAIEAVRRVLQREPRHQVAWTAQTGREAVEKCVRDRPDLILMDLVMPGGDGVEATRRIMAETPCAILVVTASVNSHVAKAFEALGAGALDVVTTPRLGANGDGPGGEILLKKIEMLGRLVMERTPRRPSPAVAPPVGEARPDRLIAIGASAGGPAALAALLGALPRDFAVPIVMIQHVDRQFSLLMASWLQEQSGMPVRVAQEGDVPCAGQALLAGTNDHLVLKNGCDLGYTEEPRESSYRPSVDAFFASVAEHWIGDIAGVLLTGMGRDGAKGLKLLREKGALTIAQDRATSVVYGMPKAAVELKAAVEVLPLQAIAGRLTRHFSLAV